MNVTFYNFAKKENSTATPAAGSGTLKTCYWKTPGSIQAPVIELESATLPGYNYCYIQETNRYYFITGTSYNAGVWELSLRVDVLASFKSDIGGTSMYVERASAEKTGSLIDKAYPLTDVYTVSHATIKSSSTFANGTILLNVLSGASNSGTTSYVMTVQDFGNFLDNIMVDADSSLASFDQVLQSIYITNKEPLKYLLGAYWLPGNYSEYATGSALSQLKMGNFVAIGFTCYKATDSLSALTRTYTITLPKHPQASARGSFCNLEPYSEYSVDLGPFGSIKLDSCALSEAVSITITVMQDLFTGTARATITTDGGAMIANLGGNWAVPIKVSSVSKDFVGATLQVAGGIAGTIGAAAAAPMSGGVSLFGLAGSIGAMTNGIDTMGKGIVSSGGTLGALVDHLRIWALDAKFYTIANDDNANFGRPLFKVRTPAALGGFVKVTKGLVQSANASRTELDSINAYMEGGFYYE